MNPTQNDGFGNFGAPAGGFSGGNPQVNGGSIMTGGLAQKSGHKKWWVFLVVILVLAMIGGGVFALWKSGVFGGGTIAGNEKTIDEAFNEFANYLLYGEESTNEVEDFDVLDTYYIDENDGDIEYLDQLLVLFENFRRIANSGDEFKISAIDEEIEFLKEYRSDYVINIDDLFNFYVKDGTEGAKNYIDNIGTLIGDTNYYLNTYFALDSARADALIKEWDYLKNNGCIISGNLDEAYLKGVAGNEDFNKLAVEYGNLDDKYSSFPNTVVVSLKNYCSNINDELRGYDVEE